MTTQIDDYIETYTGKKFYFLEPSPEDIDIEDIAHALSMQVRYTGHVKRFYSIAEHSLVVSRMCHEEDRLWGLLHDASEAYLTDVASPVKPFLGNYRELEKNLMKAICSRYGLSEKMPDSVKDADVEALRHESFVLMKSKGLDWKINKNYKQTFIVYPFNFYTPRKAKKAFLDEFYKLTGEK